ncbi:hypothetical protein BBP00_00000857 [Phytophthora kernoviae]|uniref:Uncharacterized protein n=1 Tax=Phytophthora kernoviae TaxID=325452 RepID=A0A3F2S1X7_9STRA|nr:hypothetical protein BBP00_00000857 [Phytophthora kernoviae]
MKPAIHLAFALAALTAATGTDATPATSCASCGGCLWTYTGGTQCFTNTVKEQCDAWGTGYTWGCLWTYAGGTQCFTSSAKATCDAWGTGYTCPYIDLGWGTGSTLVSRMTITGLNAITLAFASGECGSESWPGISSSGVVSIINTLVAAKKKYIIATGGESGVFTCASDANFLKFIKTYASDYLVGFDFDIEGTQTQAQIDSLVQRAKNAQSTYPNLRYSFTVASLGQSAGGNPLNSLGGQIINSIKTNGLTNYLINLMAMDYQSISQYVCVVSNGICDMGLSANQAAKNLNSYYSIPYSKIEVTVMIGGNDFPKMPTKPYVFTIDDVTDVSTFATSNGLAGVHFWSLDRDQDCPPGDSVGNCNTYGAAGTLGFTKKFQSYLQ